MNTIRSDSTICDLFFHISFTLKPKRPGRAPTLHPATVIHPLLVEQNALMALKLASRGYVLETGRVQLADTAEALIKNDRVKKAYLGG